MVAVREPAVWTWTKTSASKGKLRADRRKRANSHSKVGMKEKQTGRGVALSDLSEAGYLSSFHCCPETGSLYVEFRTVPGAEAVGVAGGLNIDLDKGRQMVGFDIDYASWRLDLSTLETGTLPIHSIKAR